MISLKGANAAPTSGSIRLVVRELGMARRAERLRVTELGYYSSESRPTREVRRADHRGKPSRCLEYSKGRYPQWRTPQLVEYSPETDTSTGERRAWKLASGVRRGARGKGRCESYLACGLPYFIVTGASKELLEQEVKPLVEQFLRERGLELSPEKTVITHIDQGFDFLGQTVRRYHEGKQTKFFITPSKKNVKAFLRKIRQRIKGSRSETAAELISDLNPQIRGWAMYHRHVVSKQVFHDVDHAIFQALWAWARRRHRNKPRRWIKAKYSCQVGLNHWVFTGMLKEEGGQMRAIRLFAASSIRIQRHTKIR